MLLQVAGYCAEHIVTGEPPSVEGVSVSAVSGTAAVMAGQIISKAACSIASKPQQSQTYF